jgi:integrase
MQDKPKRQRVGANLYRNSLDKFEDIRQYADGKQRLVTLKARTKTEALKEQRALVVKLDRGEAVAPTDKTVRTVGDEWLAQHDGRPRTHESYSYHLRQTIFPRLGDRKLQAVTPRVVGELIAWMRDERKLSARTQSSALTVLFGLCEHAVWTGILAANPVAQVPKSKRPKKPTGGNDFRVLEADEIERLIAEVPETYRGIVQVAVWSGMRQSEILGLVWSDIDLKNGQVNLSKQLSRARKDAPAERVPLKTGDRRTIEIDPGLVEILRTHKEQQFALGFAKPTDYVFCTLPDGKPIHSRNLGKAFSKAATARGSTRTGSVAYASTICARPTSAS